MPRHLAGTGVREEPLIALCEIGSESAAEEAEDVEIVLVPRAVGAVPIGDPVDLGNQ